MILPPGVSSNKSNHICKLNKSLYGLKQASRQWNAKLLSSLFTLGYHQSAADSSLLIRSSSHSFTSLLIYVDDIVLTGNDIQEIDRVKHHLDAAFRIKDLGHLRFFLGFEVAISSSGLIINQRKYALELIADAGLLASKPASTPMDPSVKLQKEHGNPYSDIAAYRRLVGRLLYLTNTRPDINFVVQQLTQFVAKPIETHYQAVVRILRYLKASPSKGLFFPVQNDLTPSGFANADWACCIDTRRSVSGLSVFLGSSLVSWKTKKQTTVSRSSSEAEYRALANLACELQWISFLLRDLQLPLTKSIPVFCDSQSAIYLAHNPTFHERTLLHSMKECKWDDGKKMIQPPMFVVPTGRKKPSANQRWEISNVLDEFIFDITIIATDSSNNARLRSLHRSTY
ncbi:uncharacterized mitochondrial protein AtMg00810-like [Gastrolobium bilobum]|uniref:uncharacterized mitochondrial protein AtMg00810-like n=1 Tax=Gastrolobium bilobum TaxID=150636 RepID=UPI002AB2E2D5|nr:uncharacterized mitochondrial protein AtMg00810-like [Gastrolobium bilobum]